MGAPSSVKSEPNPFLNNISLPFLLCLAERKGSRDAGVRAPCSSERGATGSSVCSSLGSCERGEAGGAVLGVCPRAAPEENVVSSTLE